MVFEIAGPEAHSRGWSTFDTTATPAPREHPFHEVFLAEAEKCVYGMSTRRTEHYRCDQLQET